MSKTLGYSFAVAVLLLADSPAAFAAGTTATASIRVDVTHPAGKVNPWVFGNNTIGYQKGCPYADEVYWNRGSGVWDPEQRRSVPEMVTLAKDGGFSTARYPGGTASSIHDWKKTIGPLKDRPEQQFGLPEYLRNCRDIGAEPVITLAVYAWKGRDAAGQLQDAVDLVEYLNAPDDGKHPWAARRAADGHPEPWHVTWFEFGNETDIKINCNWGWVAFSPESYARAYLAYQKAMKAVDPAIKLGAHMETGMNYPWAWPRRVLEICGKTVDFLICHTYFVNGDNFKGRSAADTFPVALAAPAQVQGHFDDFNDMVRVVTGRKNIPIAVTEYTSCINLPDPLNTLGTGLNLANILPVFMQDKNNIVMTNYWQFANETFGMVRGYTHKGEKLIQTPDYLVMRLYHQHFGKELLMPRVACDTYALPNGYANIPMGGKGIEFRLFPGSTPVRSPWELPPAQTGIDAHVSEGDVFTVTVNAPSATEYSGAWKSIDVKPNTGYRFSGWVKTANFHKVEETQGQTVYSAFFEARDTTGAASANVADTTSPEYTAQTAGTAVVGDAHGLGGTEGWTKLMLDYVTGPATTRLCLTAKIGGSRIPIHGQAFFKELSYQTFIPRHFPAPQMLSVNASRSFDGTTRKVYLMIINRNMESPVTTSINLTGCRPKSARAWELNGPSLEAKNSQANPDLVKITERDLGPVVNGFAINLQPHSVTAVEVTVNGQD